MLLIHLAGFLGADPEVRYTSNGLKVTTFRVAANIRRSNKEKTIWWRITCWGDRFDKKLAYLKKGSPVYVIGDMGIPEIYQDKDNNPQTSFEITAEYVGFSPYGKSDKMGEKGEQEGDARGFQANRTNEFQPKSGVMVGSQTQQDEYSDDDTPF